MLGAGLIGYFQRPTRPVERVLLLAGSVLLIFPGLWSDLGGIACLVVVLVSQRAARAARATEVA